MTLHCFQSATRRLAARLGLQQYTCKVAPGKRLSRFERDPVLAETRVEQILRRVELEEAHVHAGRILADLGGMRGVLQ